MSQLGRKLEEGILLLKIRHGDQEAFTVIYERYVDALFRYVSFRVRNQEIAQDISSELFLRVWQYLTDGERQRVDNLRAFLYQVARNLIADHYRAAQETLPLDEALNIDAEAGKSISSIEQRLSLREVEEGLTSLRPESQEIIILAYVEGLSSREIASIIGKTTSATRVMLHRALQELKKVLNKGNP